MRSIELVLLLSGAILLFFLAYAAIRQKRFWGVHLLLGLLALPGLLLI